MALLDDESRALLGLLARPAPAAPAAGQGPGGGPHKGAAAVPRPLGAFGADLTNRRAAVCCPHCASLRICFLRLPISLLH